MPLLTLQQLAARERTRQRNRQLGALLAFMAGAINAGGFLAVQRYTSHMTGVVSSIADDLVLGHGLLVLAGLGALLAFVAGAATTAILVNWARRRGLQGEYALSLALEALLLLLFGLLGANLNELIEVFMPTTVLLLCFIMGLQNAIVTKISQAEIRTTHMTGVITDLGIELGRLLYWNRSQVNGVEPVEPVRANRDRMRILALILGLFFAGGLLGAWAFKAIGYSAVLPLAAVLAVVALPPLLNDVRERLNTP
jgi:uncharacterized membrane protein YoaK (UPF0700 family)